MDHHPIAEPAKLLHGHVDPRAPVTASGGTHQANYFSHSSKAKAPVPISAYSTDAVGHDDHNRHRYNHRRQQPQPHPVQPLYGECLKNHAAALGGHALDGCGEFMPSPSSDPTIPTSLTCAACGCHRNFHRRRVAQVTRTSSPVPVSSLPLPQQPVSFFQYRDSHRDDNDEEEDADQREEKEEEDDENEDDDEEPNEGSDRHNPRSSNNTSSAYTLSSAGPHMLMALSAGTLSHSPPPSDPAAATQQRRPAPSDTPAGQVHPRKRFRTRFSPEQKEKMHELSEHLGWRLQKRDEAVVEERCRQIGVGKGVFKVWMHNNKHSNGNRGPRMAFPNANANANGSTALIGDNKSGDAVTSQGYGNGGESNGGGHNMVTGSCSSSPSPPRC